MGCAIPLVCLLVIFGGVGVLTGNWAALAAPKVPPAPPAVADIPTDYLVLYQDAAARFGLDWPVLAAVGRVETNHGRNPSPNGPDGLRSTTAVPSPVRRTSTRHSRGTPPASSATTQTTRDTGVSPVGRNVMRSG